MAPLEALSALKGPEWSVGGLDGGVEAGPRPAGGGFGDMLGKQIASLNEAQNDASKASLEVATGQASDPTAAVMAVERARLSMQLATSVRTKLTEAFNDVMRTQV